jgi:repressor LexA
MGIPLISSVFGDMGVFYGTTYLTIFNFMIWTYGLALMQGKQTEKRPLKERLRPFCSPTMICIAIGVGMYYLLSENEGDDLVFMVDKMLESKVIIPVLGKVPAGVPYEAIENSIPETYETIPKNWLKGDKKYFALILDGDSMEPKYHDGDTAIFLKTPTCESGDLCCVRIGNNEATFKKVTLLDDGILVSPLNKNNSSGFSETFYSAEKLEMEPIEIIGTLVECRPSNIIK